MGNDVRITSVELSQGKDVIIGRGDHFGGADQIVLKAALQCAANQSGDLHQGSVASCGNDEVWVSVITCLESFPAGTYDVWVESTAGSDGSVAISGRTPIVVP